jgi:hypothetical protein
MPRRSREDEEDDVDDSADDRPKYRKRERPDRAPKPVKGEVVGTSKVKLLGLLLVGLVFLFACGFLLFDGLVIGEANTFLPFRLTWWGYILVVIGLGIGLLCPAAAVFSFLRPTQLVFGKRVFQEQRKSGGGWVVILQIPYANVRKVRFEKVDDNTHVGIRFHDADDADTYIEDETAHETAQKKGWDFILDGLFTKRLKEIASELEDRVRDEDDDE